MKSFQTFVHVRLPALLIKRLLTQPVFGSYSAAGLLIKWGNARGKDVMGWISASKKCLWERTQHPPCTTFCLLQQSWGHVNCMGCFRTDGADNKKVRSSLLLGTLMCLRQLEGCFRKHCLLVLFLILAIFYNPGMALALKSLLLSTPAAVCYRVLLVLRLYLCKRNGSGKNLQECGL